MTPPREWDAGTYDRVAAPMTSRGTELVDALELDGAETVLDAGCGTGQVTAHLLERLPQGRVIALDASEAMLDLARQRFAGDGRVTVVRADLMEPLPVDERIDVIVSTSTFHWVPDHDRLFANLHAVLEPGGFLSAECGGAGNVASVLAHVEALGVHEHPWEFASAETTIERLTRAGFTDATARTYPRPAHLEPDAVVEYLRSVVLGAHVDALGPERGEELVQAVAARMDEPVIDYVRLAFTARKPAPTH